MRSPLQTLLVLLLVCTALPSHENERARARYQMHTVVIDAGHGGHDTGCHGLKSYEKNVTLSVALKLGALIEKNMPGIKVIYTRKTDEFIELYERANIANRNKADLFISIHCNANPNTEAYGTESWTMGLHKTNGNLEVAKRENSAILLENDYQANYNGFDPNSAEGYIVFTLNQNAFIDQSLNLAADVENEFKHDGRPSRGVKQAGFLVLWRTVMPSILIETGFLTNPKEEKYMISDGGQNEIARSIFDAVSRYKTKMETEVNALYKPNDSWKSKPTTTSEEKQTPPQSIDAPTVDAVATADTAGAAVQTVALNTTTYRVQIAASSKPLDPKSPSYKHLRNAVCERDGNGTCRLMTEPFLTLDDAKHEQERLKQFGFKGSFIVSYQNGVRGKVVY